MIEPFPDRSDQLFGRAADIRRLVDRASRPGLTALVARPLMGKSWTLTEVARQLQDQGELVGYHESKGGEVSHLLYAVSNLYARWLCDSTMREQAISLWTRHKEALVPRVGQMVGTLFEKLGGGVVPGSVAGLVRQAFDGLAEAQRDLLSGGLQIAPLPYDQALSLTRLVAEVSGRRVVLMLDAWEKSTSARSEYSTLEALLKHLDSWPHTHVFLAVRYPELAAAKDNEAYQWVLDLCNLSPSAQLYALGEMSLTDAAERRRLVTWIKGCVAAARQEADDRLAEMIDAYPGVLYFWTNEANRTSMATSDDLRKVAGNAQVGRYAELDRLLKAVPEARCAIAARLAFLPRLDEARWEALHDLVLGGLGITEIEGLIDAAVLNDERAPTYDHDTRQAAARKWFVENRGPMIRRVSEKLIEAMAAHITGMDLKSLIYFQELIGCQGSAEVVRINPDIGFLIDAACCPFGYVDGAMGHEFDVRCKAAVQRNPLLAPIIGMALNSRGLAKRQSGDSEGAIADYTAVIELPGAPVEDVGLALTTAASRRANAATARARSPTTRR